jgi:hypothetical protein
MQEQRANLIGGKSTDRPSLTNLVDQPGAAETVRNNARREITMSEKEFTTVEVITEVLSKLQPLARRLRDLGEREESAKEHSIRLDPDIIRREMRVIAAELKSTLVWWEEADAAIADDDQES